MHFFLSKKTFCLLLITIPFNPAILLCFKGIVIKSKQNVFLDKNKCIKFANKNKMFITVK